MKITKQLKEGFLPIWDVLIPKSKDEKWIFLAFFCVYACFSILFFAKYQNHFPHWELLNYDIGRLFGNLCAKQTSLLPFNCGFRHPLLSVFFLPVNLLVYITQLLYFGALPLQYLVVMLFYNLIAALSVTIIHKYCVQLIKNSKIQALILCIVYALCAHVLLLSFVPETFQFSLLGLLLVVYITTDNILNHKKISVLTNVLLFVYAAGTTLTNGAKCTIAQLFQQGNFKDKRKSIVWSVGIFVLLAGISFLVNYFAEDVPGNNFAEFIFSGESHIISEMFFEPVLFHNHHPLWGTGQGIFTYNSIFPIIINCIFYAIVACAIFITIGERAVLFLLSFFGVDIFIHLICGFGIADLYIYCLHWLFIFPLLIGWLYKTVGNKKIITVLNIVLVLLGVSFAINNMPLIIELIY